MWSVNGSGTVGTEIAIAQVVGEDKDNVGWLFEVRVGRVGGDVVEIVGFGGKMVDSVVCL